MAGPVVEPGGTPDCTERGTRNRISKLSRKCKLLSGKVKERCRIKRSSKIVKDQQPYEAQTARVKDRSIYRRAVVKLNHLRKKDENNKVRGVPATTSDHDCARSWKYNSRLVYVDLSRCEEDYYPYHCLSIIDASTLYCKTDDAESWEETDVDLTSLDSISNVQTEQETLVLQGETKNGGQARIDHDECIENQLNDRKEGKGVGGEKQIDGEREANKKEGVENNKNGMVGNEEREKEEGENEPADTESERVEEEEEKEVNNFVKKEKRETGGGGKEVISDEANTECGVSTNAVEIDEEYTAMGRDEMKPRMAQNALLLGPKSYAYFETEGMVMNTLYEAPTGSMEIKSLDLKRAMKTHNGRRNARSKKKKNGKKKRSGNNKKKKQNKKSSKSLSSKEPDKVKNADLNCEPSSSDNAAPFFSNPQIDGVDEDVPTNDGNYYSRSEDSDNEDGIIVEGKENNRSDDDGDDHQEDPIERTNGQSLMNNKKPNRNAQHYQAFLEDKLNDVNLEVICKGPPSSDYSAKLFDQLPPHGVRKRFEEGDGKWREAILGVTQRDYRWPVECAEWLLWEDCDRQQK